MNFLINKKMHGMFRLWCKSLSRTIFKDMDRGLQINLVHSKVKI